jgi:DNA-binding NtrC family response regulator
MTKPLIAILSQSPRFTSELHAMLEDSFRFAVCESIGEVRDFFQSNQPWGFVADFEQGFGSGSPDVQLIDDLLQLRSELRIVAVMSADCPEPLARLVARNEITHVCSSENCEQIAALFHEQLAAKPEAPTASKAGRRGSSGEAPVTDDADHKAKDDEAKTVMKDITRRFETNTPQMHQMLADLEIAAKHDVTILLIGETGSGKTFLSKLIHEVSPRCDEPFLPVACGALPAELIESELFGHVKGAFTSAHANKDGKFVAAGRGTILLDEIDVLGPDQQVKLLRVIETGEFEPVGSNQTLKSQARLVVASNLDLQPLVEQGKFRPDLYYRLNMLKFDVLPLRERNPDIIPLARKFITQLSDRHNVEIKRIDDNLFDVLEAYPWPGNVRELENVIQRAVIYSRDHVLSVRHLPPHIVSGVAGPTNDPSVILPKGNQTAGSLGQRIALTERDLIEDALFKNNFSRTNTAKVLGISRVTLYNKMKKHGMSQAN